MRPYTVREGASVVVVTSTVNEVAFRRRRRPVKKSKSTRASHTKLDPMVLAEVKRIIRPTQKYIILSETEALLVPR